MHRQLSSDVLVSGQIGLDDLAQAKAAGVTLIVNNRPDGEEPGQPAGQHIAEQAATLGMNYAAVPVDHSGLLPEHIVALTQVLEANEGKALLFCRSGTRSALLWALVEASRGEPADRIADAVARAGYSVAPIREALDTLAAARH